MEDAARIVFVCPTCEGSAPVTASVRRSLIDEGCVYCGATVPPDAFAMR